MLSLSPECEPGRYGEGCRKKCSCSPDTQCDHVTGQCWKECPQGYHGENCDQGEVVGLEVASNDPNLGSRRAGSLEREAGFLCIEILIQKRKTSFLCLLPRGHPCCCR